MGKKEGNSSAVWLGASLSNYVSVSPYFYILLEAIGGFQGDVLGMNLLL